MEYEYSFEKLIVWQNSRELSMLIYNITETFPKTELYGIISQMRRAAISIASNIAEGSGRNSMAEYARFVGIAYGSIMELYCQVVISADLKYITAEEFNTIKIKIHLISNQLNSLRSYLKNQCKTAIEPQINK